MFIRAVRDDGFDALFSQPTPYAGSAITLISQQAERPTACGQRLLNQQLEVKALVTLPRREMYRQRKPCAVR